MVSEKFNVGGIPFPPATTLQKLRRICLSCRLSVDFSLTGLTRFKYFSNDGRFLGIAFSRIVQKECGF
jgi:hypothetical protein